MSGTFSYIGLGFGKGCAVGCVIVVSTGTVVSDEADEFSGGTGGAAEGSCDEAELTGGAGVGIGGVIWVESGLL